MSDMHADEFRAAGHKVIEWAAAYLANIRDLPVLPSIQPGELSKCLPDRAPDAGERIDVILRDFERLIIPANTHWNHPRFHAYFSNSASGPGILAEALTAALNVNGMVWKSSPAATELEQVVLGWLRDWLGLPRENFGVIYDTASTSTMHALAAAREYKDPEARTRGIRPGLIVYASEQAHSSVEKGAMVLGFGTRNVRKIAVDEAFRMRVDALEAAMRQDIETGLTPCCVVPTVGTTSTTAIDPVRAIAQVAKRYDAWLHVDAAYGGSAAVASEYRHILDGVEFADSFVVNPHKWLFVPVDCSVLYTRRPGILRRAFSLVPEYLKTAQDEEVVNFMDYGVPLGRRFRSLKLWMVMRYFGRERTAAIIGGHIQMAQNLAQEMERDGRFEVVAPVPLSLVCFRLKASDEENRALMDRINAGGKTFLSHTVLRGRFVLRVALGNVRLTHDDMDVTWEAIRQASG